MKKLILVKHPKTNKPYGILADVETEGHNGEGTALLGVMAVVELLQLNPQLPPIPRRLHEDEGIQIVQDCIDQIAEMARGFIV